MKKRLSFAKDNRGVVALIFLLAIIPAIEVVGLAIDYSAATKARSELDVAADLAALAATTSAVNSMITGSSVAVSKATGQALGQQWLVNEIARLGYTNTSQPSVSLISSDGGFTGTATYSVKIPTSFGNIFHLSFFYPSNAVMATTSTGGNTDVIFLLDVSQSMLMGGTASDIATMENSAAMGHCALACHVSPADAGIPNGPPDTYPIAKALIGPNGPVRLRLDYLISAVNTVIDTLNAQNASGQIRVGIYTFNSGFTALYPLNTDLNGAANAISAMPIPYAPTSPNGFHMGDTMLEAALNSTAGMVSAVKSAPSAAGRKQLVVMVTDGVNDPDLMDDGETLQDPVRINQSVCGNLKATGASLAILNLDYPPLHDPANADGLDETYDWMENGAPWDNEPNPTAMAIISPPSDPYLPNHVYSDMQTCGSSPQYVVQSDGGSTMAQTLLSLVQKASLTRSRIIK